MKDFKRFEVFPRGFIRDALNLMRIMHEEQITTEELDTYSQNVVPQVRPKFRKVKKKDREREFKDIRWGRQRRRK